MRYPVSSVIRRFPLLAEGFLWRWGDWTFVITVCLWHNLIHMKILINGWTLFRKYEYQTQPVNNKCLAGCAQYMSPVFI
jgi:hypothetical protein